MFAVVTGATKGIGRAVTDKLAKAGSDLFLVARTVEDLEEVQHTLQQQHSSIRVSICPADLSKEAEVKKVGQQVQKQNIPVDLLINNAGRFIQGSIHNEPEGVLPELINTNLYSAYYLTRALIEDMKEREQGHIVNVCSTASLTAYTNGGAYCISKHGLLGLTKVLREEMKPYNVKVTAVLPGATYTASWAGSELSEERFMPPEDVAQAIWCAYNMSDRTNVESITMRPQEGDIY